MEPIIDPKLFYWADVCENLSYLFIFISVFSFIFLCAFVFVNIDASDGIYDDDDLKSFKKGIIISLSFLIVSVLGAVLIPDKETIYQMIVFNNLTENNIQAGKEDIKELIDYTIDKIDEVNKED